MASLEGRIGSLPMPLPAVTLMPPLPPGCLHDQKEDREHEDRIPILLNNRPKSGLLDLLSHCSEEDVSVHVSLIGVLRNLPSPMDFQVERNLGRVLGQDAVVLGVWLWAVGQIG